MRTGWTRWNRLTGTSRYPAESPRVILAVEPLPVRGPGHRQGPGGPVRWMVEVFTADRSLPLGGRLDPVVAGNAADCSAGRAAAEQAYRTMLQDEEQPPIGSHAQPCRLTWCQREACKPGKRAMDAATRAGSSVVDSHMTDREQGTEAPRATERTEREVQT